MDIDRLTTEEREKHVQENQCFNCHKIGHRAKDCRTKPTNDQNKYNRIKKTATTARAMIRNLVADMDNKEKEEDVRGRLTQQEVTKRQIEKGARNPKFIERLGA